MKKKKNDPEPEPDAVVDMKTLRVVSRTDWGARKPRFPGIDTMWNPAQFVFLRCYSGHTNETCDKEDDCKRVIKELQKFHFGTLTDIAHNFLIAKDGTIYEGRGWKVKSQTPDYDLKKIRIDQAKTLNLAFIGNFDKKDKTPEMIQAVKDLIDFGVQNKYIHERHEYFEVYEPQFPADDYGPRRVIGDAVVDMKTLRVVSRTDWGARKPRFPGIDTMWNPAQFVFLRCYSGHTNETCDKEDDCKRVIKELQKFHFGTLTDIAHNFLIAKDGTIYEGRGWKVKSQTPDYDLKKIRIDQAKTLNLAFIGNFDKKDKTPEMIQAVKDLIDFGVQNKYIHERHEYFEVYEPQFPADDYGPRRVIGDAVVDMKTLRVVSRTDWGARKPRFPGIDTMWNPAQFVFLRCYSGHTNETCDKEDDCKRVIKELQKFHFGTLTDIAHNFLIAKDGTIYEGRGWKVKSQTPDYDLKKIRIDQAKTLNLAFIGNFDKKDKTPEMIQAVKDLIDFGVQNKYIHERHEYFEVYEPQFPADDYGPRRVIGG